MKRLLALLMTALMLVGVLAGCGGDPSDKKDGSGDAAGSTEVNLMDMYTVKDPEGVEYDQRVALYMPVLESDEEYAGGKRYVFSVIYSKDNKGVYMYNVDIFDTEESAKAYLEENGNGVVDGSAVVTESDADFFATMEAFIPDAQTWIDNMMASGMMELE